VSSSKKQHTIDKEGEKGQAQHTRTKAQAGSVLGDFIGGTAPTETEIHKLIKRRTKAQAHSMVGDFIGAALKEVDD